MDSSTSVKVAVRIKPLGPLESFEDAQHCINTVPGVAQIIAGTDAFFTFDHVFGENSTQLDIYDDCVADLLNAAFEGFNATILAYGQTGSGKTWTMGSGPSDMRLGGDSFGIIPRVIKSLFDIILQKEEEDVNSSYKVHIQFLELYGEDIKDLLEHTKTSRVTIRETATGDVFVSGAREETVTSASQMLRALEDGSRHRTTASTMMNSSSSRSHAIFTVFLEHTIESTTLASSSPLDSDEIAIAVVNKSDEETVILNYDRSLLAPQTKEVRRCKFHFVDLAGSERAKRTGAQGVQMKEGIDINKGLLALGNVISALGDENKRGKVHVPYRVSKLTRILQDSLGGNSKTLMICCVSPSEANFHESLNALRYANRARNIKNKPRVNRDPALVLVADLKTLVITLATELLEVRKSIGGLPPESATSIDELELILMNNNVYKPKLTLRTPSLRNGGSSFRSEEDSPLPLNSRQSTRSSFNSCSNIPIAIQSSSLEKIASIAFIKKEHAREAAAEERKSYETGYEIKRLKEKLRAANLVIVEQEDALVLVKSERDFYRMKWSDGFPVEAMALKNGSSMLSLFEPILEYSVHDDDPLGEKKRAISLSAEYHKEIQTLKAEISEQRKAISLKTSVHAYDNITDSVLESDLSTNVARVIAETERHLLREAKRLRSFNVGSYGDASVTSAITTIDDDNDSDASSEQITITENGDNLSNDATSSSGISSSKIEQNDLDYQRGQKVMIEEVVELEESIGLKEQLLEQLKRSQYQYEVMKAFYEKKLSDLNFEMGEKQMERQRLMDELTDLDFLARATKQELEPSEGQKRKEKALRDQLEKKDDELRAMMMRQEELSNLSKVQNRYTAQVAKLELDVSTMRSQKVSLTKSLKDEKKKHFKLLNDKAREIDQLRRNLVKSSAEAKKLEIDKLKAEEKFKDAMQAAAVQSRRRSSDAPLRGGIPSPDAVKPKPKLSRTRSLANIHIFNESDLKIKKWLDGKIGDINGREEAVASLRIQIEQQSLLLKTKESLENDRASICSSLQSLYGPQGSQKSIEDSTQTLEELVDRIESVEGQLKMKNRNIAAIEDKLRADGEIYTLPETTLDSLKKTSAGTLPASHDLIRLLFMMLIGSKSLCNQRKNIINKIEVSEKQLKADLSDADERMHAMARSHDMEQTRAANEHEEKLLSLFTHSTIGQIVVKESGIKFAESAELASNTGSASSDDSPFVISNQNSFSTQGMMSYHGRSNYSIEVDASHKLLLAAASEQCELLKERLKREDQRIRDLQGRNSELSHRNMVAREELKEKSVTINFLEDESKLFRDMANNLRAGILTLGGAAGVVILDQVKNGSKLRSNAEVKSMSDKKNSRHSGLDSDDDDDDVVEDEKILGEFINLANVISRTGSAVDKKVSVDPVIEITSPSPRSSLKSPVRKQSQSGSFISTNRDVLNRLTDPSGFTGAMKSAFGADLLRKRQIVQLIKQGASQTQTSPVAPSSNSNSGASLSPGPSPNTKGTPPGSRTGNTKSNENWGRRSLPANDRMNPSSLRDTFESPKRFSTNYQTRSPSTSSGNSALVDAKRQRRISSLSVPEEIQVPKTLGHSTFKRFVEKAPQVEPERPVRRAAARRHSVSSPPLQSNHNTNHAAVDMLAASEGDDNTEFPLHLKVLMDDIVDEMSKSRNLTWDHNPSLPKPLPSKLSALYGNYMDGGADDSPGRVFDSEKDRAICHSGKRVQSYELADELTSSTKEDCAVESVITRSDTRIEDFYPDEEDRVSTGGYLTSRESLSPNPLLTIDNRNADCATYINPAVYRRDSPHIPLKAQTQLPESASAMRIKLGSAPFNT